MHGSFKKSLLTVSATYKAMPHTFSVMPLVTVAATCVWHAVIPIITIFMIDLNQKSTIKKNRIDRRIGKKWSIYSLIDDRSFIYDPSYMIENLWSDQKIDFWRPINQTWSKIDFWSESLLTCEHSYLCIQKISVHNTHNCHQCLSCKITLSDMLSANKVTHVLHSCSVHAW